jgi:hypothetical protein
MEKQAQITRGPLLNIVARDILPSARAYSPLELEMLSVQDKLISFSTELEELRKRGADEQEQLQTEIGNLKGDMRTLERTLAKKPKTLPSPALTDNKSFINLSQQVTEQGKQLAEQGKQLVAQKKLIQEKTGTESVARSVPDLQLFKDLYATQALQMKEVYAETNQKVVDAYLQAGTQVQNVLQTELQRYHAREDEDRKRASKREDHAIDEEKKESGSKRNRQFIETVMAAGPISSKQAKLISRQMKANTTSD